MPKRLPGRDERIVSEARAFLGGAYIRDVARQHGVSKSLVYRDLSERLASMDRALAERVAAEMRAGWRMSRARGPLTARDEDEPVVESRPVPSTEQSRRRPRPSMAATSDTAALQADLRARNIRAAGRAGR